MQRQGQKDSPGDQAWDIRIEVRCGLTSTLEKFLIWGELEAFETGQSVLRREWREEIPRDLV
jgi:hypothetical protein